VGTNRERRRRRRMGEAASFFRFNIEEAL